MRSRTYYIVLNICHSSLVNLGSYISLGHQGLVALYQSAKALRPDLDTDKNPALSLVVAPLAQSVMSRAYCQVVEDPTIRIKHHPVRFWLFASSPQLLRERAVAAFVAAYLVASVWSLVLRLWFCIGLIASFNKAWNLMCL
ncbi:uncharacterized protein BCR38DRAFT_432979 [Pseudomassariella vexata]|uniref:Uncharacterized protein n=1 Tax=Pseudomassariella vexata TaxID=1141098 RepID=A0A1Y2E1U2_9PEZI|nr:uncharacterized protein BCR38DRAFT_432979 [Pseudomassariella vexata]ORY65510.1 hypothetical protein BCR38DRAFT_432979 [Pseudomassariella vexata]